jgi:predicted nucleotidyltransferase
MPPGKYAKAYFGLREGLETLFQRRADVLTEGSIENPYLRRSIEAERRPLFPTP